MFDLLTQVLLWILIGYIAWFVLKQFIPEKIYTFLGFALLVTLIVLAFFDADQGVVSEAWSILSLPFRPLGIAALFLLWKFPFKDVFQWKTLQNLTFWALVIILTFAAPIMAYTLNEQAEKDVVSMVNNTAQQGSPVMVVLAQDTTRPAIPPRTQVELTDRGNRLRYAAELYAAQPGSTVIISSGSRSDLQGGDNAERREAREVSRIMQGLGVPESQLVVDDRSSTVRESAIATEKLLRERFPGNRQIILVTSALEMRRAVATFRKALEPLGADVRVLPRATNFYSVAGDGRLKRRFRFPQDVLPDEGALAQSSQAIQEQFISVYYFLRGWLASV